jgi:hypothetical protein
VCVPHLYKKKRWKVSSSISSVLASGLPEVFEVGPDKAHACVQLVWSSSICTRCGGGGQMLMCDGTCLRSWHLSCLSLSALPSPDDPPEAW